MRFYVTEIVEQDTSRVQQLNNRESISGSAKWTFSYHICFLWEYSISEAFRGHPFDRQFGSTTLSEVGLGVDALRETKVSYFDQKVRVDPAMKDEKCSSLNVWWMYDNSLGLHAVSCWEVPVHKTLAGKVLHSFRNLVTHLHQLLHRSSNLQIISRFSGLTILWFLIYAPCNNNSSASRCSYYSGNYLGTLHVWRSWWKVSLSSSERQALKKALTLMCVARGYHWRKKRALGQRFPLSGPPHRSLYSLRAYMPRLPMPERSSDVLLWACTIEEVSKTCHLDYTHM